MMASNVFNHGGGSGGGDDGDNTLQTADGVYAIAANQVVLLTKPPQDGEPGPHIITILAPGNTMTDGEVDMCASKGVRITAGPPMLPPAKTGSTNGVEIVVGETQNVTIQRGLTPGVDQKIEMTPSGIIVDAGTMPVTIQSKTQITLSVAGGTSAITLMPEGIEIFGPMVQIN